MHADVEQAAFESGTIHFADLMERLLAQDPQSLDEAGVILSEGLKRSLNGEGGGYTVSPVDGYVTFPSIVWDSATRWWWPADEDGSERLGLGDIRKNLAGITVDTVIYMGVPEGSLKWRARIGAPVEI